MKTRRAESRPPEAAKDRLVTDQLEVISRAGTPAFATDENGYITIWNKGAEELLGYPASRVLGIRCHELLCGVDLFGNQFCHPQCAVNCMAERGVPVHHFEMDVRAESGEMVATGFSIVVLKGRRAGQYAMIHFMEQIDRQHAVEALINRMLSGRHASHMPQSTARATASESQPQLTSRETQVLKLLAEGASTEDIATSLFISVPTTRNHVQNILRKLDVHSKLEAVSRAIRIHLI